MKVENALMRGFYSGLIAGMIGGTVTFLYVNIIGGWTGHGIPDVTSFEFWVDYFIYHIGVQGIFGGIFGIVYSKFHNGIPGKGIKKGFVFGLFVSLIVSISYAFQFFLQWAFTSIEQYFVWGMGFLEGGLLIWIPYGLVLGLLYERWQS